MANRYWRGGSGTWGSTTTNWSATSGGSGGASVPVAGDSVFFTLGTTYTVTFAGGTNFSVTDFTVSAGNVTFNTVTQMNLTISGNFTVTGNTVFNRPTGGTNSNLPGNLNFYNTGGKTADSNGAALALNVNFGNSSSSSITLSSNFNTTAGNPTCTTTLVFGTLNLNGFNLTTDYFQSSNSNTRTLAFESGNIITPSFYCTNVSNMTLTKTTGAVICNTPGASYNFGNSSTGGYTVGTSGAPNLTFTGAGSTTSSTTITSNGTGYYAYWDTIDFGSTAAKITTGLDNVSMQITPSLSIYCRNLILNSSVNLTTNSIGFIQYNTGTITSNGGTFYTLRMSSNSNLTLLDSLTCGYYGYFNHAGTLNLNDFNITTPAFYSSGSTTRTINFGTGNIELTNGTGTGTVVALDCTTATGFTWTGTGGFTVGALTSGITRTFVFGTTGGSTSNAPNLSFTSGSIGPTITSGSWFNVLNFTGSTAATNTTSVNLSSLVLGDGNYIYLTPTMVGTGTITTNDKTLGGLIINGTGITINLNGALAIAATGITTLTSGTLNLNGYNLTTSVFSSSNTNTRTLNFDIGNITLTSTTAATTVLSMANATGFTWTGTGGFIAAMSTTRTFTFGTTGGSASNAPNLLLTSGASIPTITTGSWFNILDFTGTTCTPAVTSLNLNGLVLASGGTYTNLTPIMRGTGTIITNGKSLPNITIYSSGTTTLGSTTTITGDTTITAGTLNLAGFTLNTPTVTSTSASNRTISGTGNINVTGNWSISNGTNFTGSNYNINMTNASAKTFTGAGGSYGALVQAGAGILTISDSSTFADIKATTWPSTITFTAGTTQTVAYFTLSGMVSNLVTINSSSAGTGFNLSKTGGAVTASYLNIQDSNATGGATWRAYNGTNTNSGNNTGWAFVYVPPSITGQFMAFF
jgi:hypothetical protein